MAARPFDSAVTGGTAEALEFITGIVQASTEYSIIAARPDGTIVLWNEGAQRLFGYPPSSVLGQMKVARLQALPDGAPAPPADWLGRAEAAGKWSASVPCQRQDGSRFTALLMVTPWRDAHGAGQGFLLIAKDLSDEARQSEEIFRNLLESAPDPMVIVDPQGRIVLVNSQTERLLGYRRDELLGQSVDLLVPEEARGRHPGHRRHFFENPTFRPMGIGMELRARRKDGIEFPIEISLSPLRTAEGMLVSSALRDITERKRFEQTLQDKNVELEKASQAKDRFLASMSHELRTPLNAIIGFTGTLLMKLPGPLTADQDRQLHTIQASARHLLSLINDLLDLAKIESGKVEITRAPVSCNGLLEEVASALRPLAEAKGLHFSLVLPDSEVSLLTDRRALSQIVINLTNNAIKYTERGAVTVSLDQRLADGERLSEIVVRDSGIGIRDEDQARLFQAFTQLDASSTRRYEGTGLGLHLSQKLADLLGGHITFSSEYGRGSIFTLTFRGA